MNDGLSWLVRLFTAVSAELLTFYDFCQTLMMIGRMPALAAVEMTPSVPPKSRLGILFSMVSLQVTVAAKGLFIFVQSIR